MVEALALWGMHLAVTASIAVTQATNPVEELYHVSEGGVLGGLGRALVFMNFSFALAALFLLGVTVARVLAHREAFGRSQRTAFLATAALSVVLCLVVFWPGIVKQADLDARPINLIPAAGVLLALSLTLWTVRRTGVGRSRPWSGADRLRLATTIVLVVAGLPWILAEVGVHIESLPLFDRWFVPEDVVGAHRPRGVHLGHHHGTDGLLLAIAVIWLSRVLGQIKTAWLRRGIALYMGVLLSYGVSNLLQDFTGEQLREPGWISWHFPKMLEPATTPAWGAMLLAGGAIGIASAIWADVLARRRQEAKVPSS